MIRERRFYHLGLDIVVDVGVPLHAPLHAQVKESGYEEGGGNYGGFVLLEHQDSHFETFFSLYGHLKKDRLPVPGTRLKAGEYFAETGDFYENGNWFYHTHIQVITKQGLAAGYLSKGYCTAADLSVIDRLCPSPLMLFSV
ncbi:MAG: peptidoglycan DD-metalloendopeptidase family protein [Spirochaetales bacterium]|jgi:murein DD-endopeptidase MepM/ murein hydrolase activator NlpD|nr:peptidoglycan DD-metalloendopeptidase family protein [Spirochaetales bacterium]